MWRSGTLQIGGLLEQGLFAINRSLCFREVMHLTQEHSQQTGLRCCPSLSSLQSQCAFIIFVLSLRASDTYRITIQSRRPSFSKVTRKPLKCERKQTLEINVGAFRADLEDDTRTNSCMQRSGVTVQGPWFNFQHPI